MGIFISVLFIIAQMSIDRWMDKQNVIYPYNGILFSQKKEWNTYSYYNMDGLEVLTLCGRRQTSDPIYMKGFPGGSVIKNLPVMQELQETWVQSLGWEDPLEEGMATHSSILIRIIPWTEELGAATVHGVAKRHDWATEDTCTDAKWGHLCRALPAKHAGDGASSS